MTIRILPAPLSRRLVLLASSAALLAGCALPPTRGGDTPSLTEAPPIVFVHGNGDTAALWQTTLWRFESNGWPRSRLHAIEVPYPLARDDDSKAQPGRSSTAEQMAYLKAEVDKVLKATGAKQVVLFGNSRGGYAIRNYIQNGGGAATVSHAIAGGTPNHGVWAIKGFREGSEFSGTGPFLTALNAPKNAHGDEVNGPVRWLTIRSDKNDKFAQPDGVWIGAKGTPTNVTFEGPELKGAINTVIPRIDHRETSFSPAAFYAAYSFITGKAPRSVSIELESSIVLNGSITGLGVKSGDASSGGGVNNLPVPQATLQIFATDRETGARKDGPVHQKTVGPDGQWGPFSAQVSEPYEFVISAPGYSTTHIYRSPFPRSSNIVHLRAERLAEADKTAPSVVTFSRPRGYFDAQRDKLVFDGQTPPPGVPPTGAGVSSSKIGITQPGLRTISGEFNGERITGQTWRAAENRLVVLELTN
ncbi:MAG: twin-arginine translocation pathway signal [Burkholderiaceae bacterium]|nr:twin-arginine translocation pathway signal [Burkholderiaceae bacterium]